MLTKSHSHSKLSVVRKFSSLIFYINRLTLIYNLLILLSDSFWPILRPCVIFDEECYIDYLIMIDPWLIFRWKFNWIFSLLTLHFGLQLPLQLPLEVLLFWPQFHQRTVPVPGYLAKGVEVGEERPLKTMGYFQKILIPNSSPVNNTFQF